MKKEELEDEDTANENRTPQSDEDAVNEQLASELKASPSPNGKGAFPNPAWPLSSAGPQLIQFRLQETN